MRVRTWIPLAAACFLALALCQACAPKTVLPNTGEELHGTWVNDKNLADVFHGQKVVVTAEAIKVYTVASDTEPRMVVSWEVTEKWKDSEGNLWYKTKETSTGGSTKAPSGSRSRK